MRKSFIFCVLVSFALIMVFPMNVVKAEEVQFDRSACGSATLTAVSLEKGVKTFSFDMKGISWDNKGEDFTGAATMHCVGVLKIVGGEKTSNGYCKFMDSEGTRDYEFTKINDESTFKYIGGTGKYVGITGGGKSKTLTKVKPIVKGTFQSCARGTGTWKLPEKMKSKEK